MKYNSSQPADGEFWFGLPGNSLRGTWTISDQRGMRSSGIKRGQLADRIG